MKKPLHQAPARLQRMLMRLQRYNFTLQYRRGTSLHIADTLSRAALDTPVEAKVTGFEVFRTELRSEYPTHHPRLTTQTEKQIKNEIQNDIELYTETMRYHHQRLATNKGPARQNPISILALQR